MHAWLREEERKGREGATRKKVLYERMRELMRGWHGDGGGVVGMEERDLKGVVATNSVTAFPARPN